MSKAETSGTQKRKKHSFSRYMGLFFIAVIIYVIVNIIMTSGNMQTTIVQRGTEEEVIKSMGYIFCDSTVITAPTSGYLACEVAEDARVKEGETIVSVYKNEINYRANSELRAIEEKIARLSQNPLEKDMLGNDPVRIEQSISDTLREIYALSYMGDAESIAKMCDDINIMINKKRIISGQEVSDQDAELESLKSQKAQIEKNNNVDRTMVHTPVTGAFTAVVDGLEEKLSTARLTDVTPTYLKELDKFKVENLVKDKVNTGDPVGKVVKNFSWNVAVLVTEDEAKQMRVGDEVGIRFTMVGGEAVSGTVTHISKTEEQKAVVIVNSNKYIDSVYSTSKAEVEIIRNSYEGFRIPAKSIRIINQEKGVYVIRNDMARFVPVETLYTTENWVIVAEKNDAEANLKLYDELIVSGKDLYNGKDVR